MTITLRGMVQCVERELKMRRSVYPRWIAAGRMTEEGAAREIATMEAVLDNLRRQLPRDLLGELAR